MGYIVSGFFILVCVGDFFFRELRMVQIGKFLPEAAAAVLVIPLVAVLMHRRKLSLPGKFLVWALLFSMALTAGAIANQVPTGAIVFGIREYFKYAPLFILPLVYEFNEKQLRLLFGTMIVIGLLQLPLTLYQRLFEVGEALSGDHITGSFHISSWLSCWLIALWSVVFAFFLRHRVNLFIFLVLSVLILAPTMLNETKGSLFLFPLAAFIPFVLLPSQTNRFAKLMIAGIFFLTFVVASSVIYGVLYGERFGQTPVAFLLSPELVLEYLSPASQGGNWLGRFDKISIGWEQISQSFTTMFLGMGIGNTVDTSMELFSGNYTDVGKRLLIGTGFNYFLWETGVIGVFLVMLIPVMIFWESRFLASRDDVYGYLANGWAAVSAIAFLGMFYIRMPEAQAVSFSFWFISGVIVGQASRVREAQMHRAPWSMDGVGQLNRKLAYPEKV